MTNLFCYLVFRCSWFFHSPQSWEQQQRLYQLISIAAKSFQFVASDQSLFGTLLKSHTPELCESNSILIVLVRDSNWLPWRVPFPFSALRCTLQAIDHPQDREIEHLQLQFELIRQTICWVALLLEISKRLRKQVKFFSEQAMRKSCARQIISKTLFFLQSNYRVGTPYQVWFNLDNFLTR